MSITDYTHGSLKHACFLILFFSFSFFAIAQTKITDKVTGTDGKPFSGATVAIKGTNVATTTADDGSFSISVPNANATLVVSYVGYESQEVRVSSLSNGVASVSLSPLANSM